MGLARRRACFASVAFVLTILLAPPRKIMPFERRAANYVPESSAAIKVKVLVTSEQHLQRVGSDRRLLALLKSMRTFEAEVSLLVRTRKCGKCVHSPPISALCKLLGAASAAAMPLDDDYDGQRPKAPPAVYEYKGTRTFARLLQAWPFDLILIGLWFWYDPQPSFAELLLPVARAHVSAMQSYRNVNVEKPTSGSDKPLIALFTDDAHSERARKLAAEEPQGQRASEYLTQARNMAARQTELYSEADAVFYLTYSDRELEAALRRAASARHGGGLRSGVLEMQVQPDALVQTSIPRQARSLPRNWHVHDDKSMADDVLWVGFVGDGHTATNALGLHRFIREGWTSVRKRWPRARLRVVGRIPTGHRAGGRERPGGKNAPCLPR